METGAVSAREVTSFIRKNGYNGSGVRGTEELMGRRTLYIVLVVAGLLTLGAGVRYAARPDPVKVTLRAVERGVVESTVANTRAGTVKPCRRAKLSPAAGGMIATLNVREGSRVNAGDILLEVWNKDLRARIEFTKGRVASAESRAEEICLLAQVSDREAARILKLRRQGLASERTADTTSTDAAARKAACNAARQAVKTERAQLGVDKAALERTILRAPFAGVVAEVNGERGEFTTPSPPGIPTPPAVDLIDDSCIYVSAPLDEVDAPAVKVGLPARISLDAFRNRFFPGHVRRIAPYVLDLKKQARTVDVEVAFDNPEDTGGLLAGYSADVEVILSVRNDVVRVPAEAVVEGNRVYVYDPAGDLLRERTLKTGLANWEYVEVIDGVSAGERVVTSVEREGIRDGARAVIDEAVRPQT